MTFTQGLHLDVPNKTYHAGMAADPKPLSSSMGKTLVMKSPAEFRWEQDHRIEKAAFDEGQAVHELVLEGGFQSIDVLPFDDWRTKAAKEARDESYAGQRHPLLSKDVQPLFDMADAVKASERAQAALSNGRPEVSALAFDPEYGINLQARFDWLQLPEWGSERSVIVDLKTSVIGANPRTFNREIAERRYHLSMAFYRRVLMLLGHDDPDLMFVVVDKKAPHLVSTHLMSESDRIIGDLLVSKAIATYAACVATDDWPGFDTEIHETELPAWASFEAGQIAGLTEIGLVF